VATTHIKNPITHTHKHKQTHNQTQTHTHTQALAVVKILATLTEASQTQANIKSSLSWPETEEFLLFTDPVLEQFKGYIMW